MFIFFDCRVAYVNSVKEDTYGFFGIDVPCVLLTDELSRRKARDDELIEKSCKTCMNYHLNLALCKRCIGGSRWINRHNIDKKPGERSRNEEIEAKNRKITIEEIGGHSFVCVHSLDGDRITCYPIEEYGKRWYIVET